MTVAYRLLWLPDVIRAAGLTVTLEPGWDTRGKAFTHEIDGVIGHHTASNKRSGDCPSTHILITGRPDLSPPLAQVQLCRSGNVHVIASGIANHAGTGAWPGIRIPARADGGVNGSTIGIEAENDGLGDEVWGHEQMSAYAILVACLLEHLGHDESRFCAHYEWRLPKGYKVDPRGWWEGGGDWYSGGLTPTIGAKADWFRQRVAVELTGDWMAQFTEAEKQLLLKGAQAAINVDERWEKTARSKLDEIWTDLEAFDHPELLAGKVAAIQAKVGA